MYLSQLDETLDVLLKADITPMLIGAHGVGKSTAIKSYADKRGYNFFVLRLGNMADAGDLVGLPYIEDGKTKFATPNWFPTDPDSKTIILLDEINRIQSPLILNAVFSLIEPRWINGRRLHEAVLPENCKIITAANPPTEDYPGVVDIRDQAFLDRSCHLKIEFSQEEHKEWMVKNEFNSTLVSFCSEFSKDAYPKTTDFSLDYVKSSSRTIQAMQKILEQDPSQDVLKQCALGLMGLTSTINFLKHLEDRKQILITPDQILTNFSIYKSTIEEMVEKGQVDVISEITSNLIQYIDSKNLSPKELDNISIFLKTIPKDILVGQIFEKLENPNILKVVTECNEIQETIKDIIK